MAQFNGRGPNVSQYLANLNRVPGPSDLQEFPLEDDLALFTNSDFFDFDTNDFVGGNHAQQMGFNAGEHAGQDPSKGMNFVNQQSHAYGEFPTYHGQRPLAPNSLPPSPPNGIPGSYAHQSQPTVPGAAAFASISSPLSGPNPGEKRKAGSMSVIGLEDVGSVAAEEDKRRRNTAASARFRVKKKQREQALEKSAKEMSDKVQILESKVTQLQQENTWLKSLITEKNLKIETENSVARLAESRTDSKTLDTSEAQEEQQDAERSTRIAKRGVGTNDEAVEA